MTFSSAEKFSLVFASDRTQVIQAGPPWRQISPTRSFNRSRHKQQKETQNWLNKDPIKHRPFIRMNSSFRSKRGISLRFISATAILRFAFCPHYATSPFRCYIALWRIRRTNLFGGFSIMRFSALAFRAHLPNPLSVFLFASFSATHAAHKLSFSCTSFLSPRALNQDPARSVSTQTSRCLHWTHRSPADRARERFPHSTTRQTCLLLAICQQLNRSHGLLVHADQPAKKSRKLGETNPPRSKSRKRRKTERCKSARSVVAVCKLFCNCQGPPTASPHPP